MEIKSKNHFVNVLSKLFESDCINEDKTLIKKTIGRLISRGYTIEVNNCVLTLYRNRKGTDSIQENTFPLQSITKDLWLAILKNKITKTNIIFKNGYTINVDVNDIYRPLYVMDKDGNIAQRASNGNIYSLAINNQRSHRILNFESVTSAWDLPRLQRSILDRNYNESFIPLDYKIGFSYGISLCVKDIGCFKAGMVVDHYYQSFEFRYHERDPEDLFDMFSNSIACDLNKKDINEIKKIYNGKLTTCNVKDNEHCSRGCGRGECRSKSENIRFTRIFQSLEKLYNAIEIKNWKLIQKD